MINRLGKYGLVFLIPFIFAGCGGGDGDSSADPGSDKVAQHICNLPCLEGSPVMSVSQISTASGGEVKVAFDIRGDITNVGNVSVILWNTDLMQPAVAGSGVIISPTESHNELSIVVKAGTPAGTYYPNVSFSALTPENSGNQYYIDPTKSLSRYTYTEVVGVATTPLLTSFALPMLKVTQ